jgi:hypothetical protein
VGVLRVHSLAKDVRVLLDKIIVQYLAVVATVTDMLLDSAGLNLLMI